MFARRYHICYYIVKFAKLFLLFLKCLLFRCSCLFEFLFKSKDVLTEQIRFCNQIKNLTYVA
jgi:hypothetical protein